MGRSTSAAGHGKPDPRRLRQQLLVANVETLTGLDRGADNVTLTGSPDHGPVGRPGRRVADKLIPGQHVANTGTLANIETIIGGSGADAITLSTAMLEQQSMPTSTAVPITLTLAMAASTPAFTIANVETLDRRNRRYDTVTLDLGPDHGPGHRSGQRRRGQADPAGRSPTPATVSNVETIVGGTGADTVTLGAALASSSVDLGVVRTSLALANGVNTLTLANIETVTGGTGRGHRDPRHSH